MAEKNPLLPTGLKSADNSMSSAVSGSEHHMLQANHPPAEIVSYTCTSPINSINHSPQRQKQDIHGNNSSRNRGDTRNRIPIPRSPQSSRSRTDKIASYNLEYRGKIPEASKFFFLFLIFGMILVVTGAVASGYLTLTHNVKNHSDISNIILPLIIYIMNIVECSLFYLEARTFQMRGYTQLFQDASKSSKINFRFISCYYVISLSIYGFLMHHTDSHFPDTKSRDNIFLGVWYFAYGIIIIFLFNFGKRFWIHNRDKPKPDLFFPHPNNNNYIQNSPLHRGGNKSDLGTGGIGNMQIISDDQTEVVQKLQRDKQTLMRQLESMKKKYERTLEELEQLQSDTTSSILGGGGGSNIGSLVAINSGNNIAINNETIELKKQIQKLRSKLRNEREQIKTLSTSLETKTTMLDAQKAETQQLRNVLQQKDDRIQQLMNDKESLERGIDACNDKLDDWQLLYQVKEQEVEIAKKENDRLRKKFQTNNY